jgi:hypothetical protein
VDFLWRVVTGARDATVSGRLPPCSDAASRARPLRERASSHGRMGTRACVSPCTPRRSRLSDSRTRRGTSVEISRSRVWPAPCYPAGREPLFVVVLRGRVHVRRGARGRRRAAAPAPSGHPGRATRCVHGQRRARARDASGGGGVVPHRPVVAGRCLPRSRARSRRHLRARSLGPSRRRARRHRSRHARGLGAVGRGWPHERSAGRHGSSVSTSADLLNSVGLTASRPSAKAGARTARNSLFGFEHGPQRPTKAHGMDRGQGDTVSRRFRPPIRARARARTCSGVVRASSR